MERLKPVVITPVNPDDRNLGVVMDHTFRHWRCKRYQVDPVVRYLVAFEKPDSETGRDEVPRFGIQMTAIRMDVEDVLDPRVGHVRLKEQPGKDGIEETSRRNSHDVRAEILTGGGMSRAWIVMTRNDNVGERRNGERPRRDVVACADVKILERSVVRPIVPFLDRTHAGNEMRRRASVRRSDVREGYGHRDPAAQTEFGFDNDRMGLRRIVAAFAGHAVAVQVEMSPRVEILVRDRDAARSSGRHKRLRVCDVGRSK